MNTTSRNYEVLYVVDPALTDEQVEAIIAKYSTIVSGQAGEVKAAGKWDKRRLAYEIMGRREGIYILMFFDGEPAVAKELDRVLRIADDVIRHIITRVEPEHVDTTRIDHPQPSVESAAAEKPTQEAAAPVEEAAAAEGVPEAEEAPAEPASEQPSAEEPAEAPSAEEEASAEEVVEPAEDAPSEEAAEEPAEETSEEPAGASEEPEAKEGTEDTGGEEPKAE